MKLLICAAALLAGTAAFAQSSGDMMNGQGWSDSSRGAFFGDDNMTLRGADDAKTRWQALAQEDRDMIARDCDAFRTGAAGAGSGAAGSSDGVSSGGNSSTGSSTGGMASSDTQTGAGSGAAGSSDGVGSGGNSSTGSSTGGSTGDSSASADGSATMAMDNQTMAQVCDMVGQF